MYKVYIIQSFKTKRYYIGYTKDLRARLKRHNRGQNQSTKSGIPWKIIHSEVFTNRSDAFKREKEIKRFKSGIKFKKLLEIFKE